RHALRTSTSHSMSRVKATGEPVAYRPASSSLMSAGGSSNRVLRGSAQAAANSRGGSTPVAMLIVAPGTTRNEDFRILHATWNMSPVVRTATPDPANARSRRTKTALLDAARAVIEAAGFGALTMARVAEQAGVTRRAAYLHFPSRTDLVTALFDHV